MTTNELQMAHVVCMNCGTRWTISYRKGNTPISPRECKNRDCEAGFLSLPMFVNEADADTCAEQVKQP